MNNEGAGALVARKVEMWRYGVALMALAATGCAVAANLSWAWGLDAGGFRTVALIGSATCDVGVVSMLFAMLGHHSAGRPVLASVAMAVWLTCSAGEICGGAAWMEANTGRIEEPAAKAREAADAAASGLAEEKAALEKIRTALIRETDRNKLRDLRKQRDESIATIERMTPKAYTATIVPFKSPVAGVELYVAFAFWLFSQAAWVVALEGMGGIESRAAIITPNQPRPSLPALPWNTALTMERRIVHSMDSTGFQNCPASFHTTITVPFQRIPSVPGETVPDQLSPLCRPGEGDVEHLEQSMDSMERERLSEGEAVALAMRLRAINPPTPWADISEKTGWPQSSLHRKVAEATKDGSGNTRLGPLAGAILKRMQE